MNEKKTNFIESIMESDNIPGLSVAVVKGEHIVWDKSFGMANIEQNIPVSDTTMFMLASVSKTVTATALMQLWEDDLINLDEDINSYLPFNVVHPDYPNISITPKMLLTHTSGIKDNWNVSKEKMEKEDDMEKTVKQIDNVVGKIRAKRFENIIIENENRSA